MTESMLAALETATFRSNIEARTFENGLEVWCSFHLNGVKRAISCYQQHDNPDTELVIRHTVRLCRYAARFDADESFRERELKWLEENPSSKRFVVRCLGYPSVEDAWEAIE